MASNAKKGSRITIACNPCRSRKQKCGGGKPVCTQCLEHNRPCDWPEQLKRGPAKGYIEVLENRLHETETVLLKVLSQIPDAQLASTLVRDQSNQSGGYSPFLRLGKRGAEYWRRFPLDTASNVRDWQQDCSSQKRPDPIDWETDRVQPESCMSSSQHAPRQDSEQAPTGYDGRRESSEEFESRNPALEVSPSAMHPTHATSPPLHLQQDASISQQQLRGRKRSANEAASLSHHSPNQRPTDHQNTSQEPSSWTGAPPVQFQEQFLW